MNAAKFFVLLILLSAACQDADDAPLANRNTFTVFYESADYLAGLQAKEVDDGFIILSSQLSASGTVGNLKKTDKSGNILWQTILPDATFKSFAVGDDGYFVIGDSIKITASDTIPVPDLIVSSLMLYRISLTGSIVDKLVVADRKSTENITDIRGNSMTFNQSNQLIVLGTYEAGFQLAPVKPFLVALNPATLDTIWSKRYDVISRDYINTKSVHATSSGHIVWASAILKEQGDFSNSYMSIPYVLENSVFENNDLLGETTEQQLFPRDIQKHRVASRGFGVVGTYSNTDGTQSNFFFSRVDNDGNFITSTIKYFDGASAGIVVSATTSLTEDEGQAIASTSDDGFVLAGTMETTPAAGNGGTDVMVIKLDSDGNVVWQKFFGGGGDESVSSIVETQDGGLLLCGTRVLGGLGSTFIMKLNSNGELKD
jgi:hypothetical protein